MSSASGASPASIRAFLPNRVTAGTQIYALLRAEIVSLRMPPGTLLSEKQVGAHFGVSRTPVHEAVIRLAEEGLVDVRPQAGTYVSRIALDALPGAVAIRQALEGTSARWASAHAKEHDIAGLDALIAHQGELAASGDTAAFHEADEAFHEAIAGISGHPGLWTYLQPAKTQIDRARRLTMPHLGRAGQVVVEHRAIRDAIAAHDGEAARSAMEAHLDAVLPDIAQLRDRFPDYFV